MMIITSVVIIDYQQYEKTLSCDYVLIIITPLDYSW